MRTFASIFIVLLGVCGPADAQQPVDPKKWEVAGSAALFYATPGKTTRSTATTGTSRGATRLRSPTTGPRTSRPKSSTRQAAKGRSTGRISDSAGNPPNYPYSVESFHRLEQAVGADGVAVRERTGGSIRTSAAASSAIANAGAFTFRSNTSTSAGAAAIRLSGFTEIDSEPTCEYRIGVTAGAGAKVYMSPNAFFNVGAVGSYSRPAATLSFLAGFGIDF